MKIQVFPWDAAHSLSNETLPFYLAGSLLNSIEDKDPGLFIDALNAAARFRKLPELGESPSGGDITRFLRALGVTLVLGGREGPEVVADQTEVFAYSAAELAETATH